MVIRKRVLHVHGIMADHSNFSGPVGGGVGRLDVDVMKLQDNREVVVVTSAYQYGHVMFEIEKAEWDRRFIPGLLVPDDDRKALSDLLAILKAQRPEQWSPLFAGPLSKGMEVLAKILEPDTARCDVQANG